MTFKLSEPELQAAFDAIEYHGYSTLFPNPPEWEVLKTSWLEIKGLLANEDLDTYSPTTPLRVFAPKNRYNVRVVTHLHPQDLIIYTALVLIIKDDIEAARLSPKKRAVFSFRSDGLSNHLYGTSNFHTYREELRRRAEASRCKYIAVADIADFYPRLYQHRLENVVATVAASTRAEEVARVLVKKFIFMIAGSTSYGIPVGPYASRVLAEALLIDVDDALVANDLKFTRWADDFTFFCASDAEAQHALFFLGRWLFEKHGLTLNGGKTKVLSVSTFIEKYLTTHEERLAASAEILRNLWVKVSPYDDDGSELTDDEIDELEQTNFKEMLERAVEDKDLVDYEMVAFILGRLSRIDNFRDEWRQPLVSVILENIEHLYPVVDSVASFFSSFSDLDSEERKRISDALLKPILRNGKFDPPDYYVMWVLSIFIADKRWNNANKIYKIFEETHSEVVQRYAALALSVTGARSHALGLRDYYNRVSPLVKSAILMASRLMGADEKKFWKRSQLVSTHLEKRL